MAVPSGAVFVAADEPLLVFASASAAQEYLEAIDVVDGVYPAAFGPKGEAYSITAQDGLVFVERSDGPERPDDLRRLLMSYLDAVGCLPPPSISINDLVETAWVRTHSS